MGVLAPADNTPVCEISWNNVVRLPATESDIAPYVSMLDEDQLQVGMLVDFAANTVINLEIIDFTGLQNFGLEYPF